MHLSLVCPALGPDIPGPKDQEGGDLLTFIEMRFNLGFIEAVRFAETMLAVSEAA